MGNLGDLLALLGVGFASALVPLINLEAYLGVRAGVADMGSIWLLGFVAGLGQMFGKVLWYYLGANALRWSWIRKKVEQPKAQERLGRWRRKTEERPALAGLLVFVSAASGFPPFAIVAVLAGQLRMNLLMFFVLGLLGRWLRFAAVLGGVAWLVHLVT